MHELLGKRIVINNEPMTINFLRADCDAGVVDSMDRTAKPGFRKGPSLLIRLSDQTVIRELSSGEDYDAAVLSAKP